MATVVKWSGDGLAPGTLTSTSAGVGDTMPTAIHATAPTVDSAGLRAPRISALGSPTSAASGVYWEFPGQTLGGGRFYFDAPATSPTSGNLPIILWIRDGVQTLVQIDITSTRRFNLRDGVSILEQSPTDAWTPGSRYRIEWRINHSTKTVAVRVFSGESTTHLVQLVGTSSSMTVSHNRVYIGKLTAVEMVSPLHFDDIVVTDTDEYVGPRDGGASTVENTIGFIGDSLTVQWDASAAVRSSLTALGYTETTARIDAASGRSITWGPTVTTQQVIADWRASNFHPKIWVIALGTNNLQHEPSTWPGVVATVLNLIAETGPDQIVFWTGVSVQPETQYSEAAVGLNTVIKAACEARSDVDARFIDTDAAWHNGRDQTGLWSDDRHHTTSGYAVHNRIIRNAIQRESPWWKNQVMATASIWSGTVERPVIMSTWDRTLERPTVTELAPLTTPDDPELHPVFGLPVWRDEFTYRDGSGNAALDPAKWNVRNNFDTFDTARGMASNVLVADETLTLRGSWLTTPLATGPQGIITHYTGYIDTRNLSDAANPTPAHHSQMYGRWEIRCQVPTGADTRGVLAAFWLRSDSHLGEIDIMEAWGGGGTMASDWTNYIKDSAVSTFHSSTMSSEVNGKPYRKTFWRHWQHGGPKPMWDGMHTIGYERTPEYQSLDVDGVELVRFTPTDTDPVNGGTLAWLWDPDFFGSPLHMRVNMHIGPSAAYWGLPDPNNRQWTRDPLDYKIEHIRVWNYEP